MAIRNCLVLMLIVDTCSTPDTPPAFPDAYYGAMGRDNTIPGQIAIGGAGTR